MHTKRKKFIFLCLLIVILLVVGGLLISILRNQTSSSGNSRQNAGVKSLSYSYCTMLGEVYDIELNELTFNVTKCAGLGKEKTTETYEIGQNLYNDLDAIIEKYDMHTWNDLPEKTPDVTCQPFTKLDIVFQDTTELHLSSELELPENGDNAISEIVEVFEMCMVD